MKFATKPIHYSPHLRRVATLSWEIKNSSADIQQIWKILSALISIPVHV